MPDQTSAPERDLLDFLESVDSEINSNRQALDFDARADLWLRYRGGDAWLNRGDRPIFMANLVGNLIERKIASLAQSKPDIHVSARNPVYASMSRLLTETCSAVLAKNELDARIERGADYGATFGHCGWNVAWDPSADYGDGDIVVSVLDPRRLFIDHRVHDVTELHRAQYIRIDTPMPMSEIRRIWPGRGAEVTSDDSLTAHRPMAGMAGRIGTKRPIQATVMASGGPYEWAVVCEYWLVSDQLGETGEPMFPTGRVIHKAGSVILDDGPNPYWDGQWPVDVWDWRVDPDSVMGRSDVGECIKLQESFNRLGNSLVKNALLNGMVSIIGDSNALSPEEWKKLDNRAARIIRKAPGREVRVEGPPTLPPSYFDLMGQLSRAMETVIGVPEAMQGKRQAGVIASSAVEGLMTAAETLVRAVARRLEYLVERIGTKIVSRVIQFYTGDRVFAVLGPGQEWQDYVFKRAELMKAIQLDPDTGQALPIADPDEKKRLREFFTQFRFKVTPMSSLPQNKIQRGLLAMQLAQAGLIDGEEVLRTIEWPNWKDVYQRVSQKQATGQMPPPGSNGGGGPKSNRRGTAMKMG